MGTHPSRCTGEQRPGANVSWDDGQHFLVPLNQQCPALLLLVPTEAPWEDAWRAGTQAARYEARRDTMAWDSANSNGEINWVSAFPGLDHGVGQPLASGLPHACPHVLLGDRGP
jgi:hypothetical protein